MGNPQLSPKLMLIPKPGTDITVVGLDITEDTMDTADTTDTLTPMDTDTTWARGPLKLNPKLKPPLRLKPNPGTDTMVDTTDIPTDITDMDVTMVVIIGRFLVMPIFLSPFELSVKKMPSHHPPRKIPQMLF